MDEKCLKMRSLVVGEHANVSNRDKSKELYHYTVTVT